VIGSATPWAQTLLTCSVTDSISRQVGATARSIGLLVRRQELGRDLGI
jgi:hypothetical protein